MTTKAHQNNQESFTDSWSLKNFSLIFPNFLTILIIALKFSPAKDGFLMSNLPLSEHLNQFEAYLQSQDLAPNPIRAYLYTLRQFLTMYPSADKKYLMLYKCYLIDRYKPQTVNLRIRAMNCYLESIRLDTERLLMVRLQNKPFLDHVISQADYEYFKTCLLRSKKFSCYFAIRLMAATGLRVSELIRVQVSDIRQGYIDLCSKGNRARRVYIPSRLQAMLLKWLSEIGRKSGHVFLNYRGDPISANGVRDRIKQLGTRFGLDPAVLYPHSFRHLFARSFIERCNDIAMLSDILGHESIETTRVYLHRSSAEQQKIFNQVVDW